MKIAISGHRPNKLGNDYNLTSDLIRNIKGEIINIIKEYFPLEPQLTLITGMALGIDTLFAQIAIEFELPFIAAIPFKGQEGMWVPSSKAVYYSQLRKAEKIVVCDMNNIEVGYHGYDTLPKTSFTAAKMQRRNEWMVDNCDLLIAVWDGSPGGTANCIKYAISIGKPIIHIHSGALVVTKFINEVSK